MAHSIKPRLLVVLATNAIGGAETQTQWLLRGLSPHFQIVLLIQKQLQALFNDIELQIVYFEERGLVNPFDYSQSNILRYAGMIAKVAYKTEASIVYAVMHNASVFLTVARWRHMLLLKGRYLIGSLHGSLLGYFKQRGNPPVWIERFLIQLVLKTLVAVITPSHGLSNELIKYFGAKADHVYTIYNGFDLENIRNLGNQIPAIIKIKDEFWIVTCCRLSDQKDFKTLLHAFAKTKYSVASRLIIIGEGVLRDQIDIWANQLGISDRIYFTGFEMNPFKWIRQADLFVLSSFYEGFGNVIVEAMALGVPVLASDCSCGPSEIIESGRSGWLFPVADDIALADLFDRLLSDKDERLYLARGAWDRANTFFVQRMVDGYMSLFQHVLRESVTSSYL